MKPLSDALHIDTTPNGTIRLAGELDGASAGSLHTTLKRSLTGQPHQLVVDVSRLDFCDSSGLAVLVQARNRLPDTSQMILHGASNRLRQLLRITGLDTTFTLT